MKRRRRGQLVRLVLCIFIYALLVQPVFAGGQKEKAGKAPVSIRWESYFSTEDKAKPFAAIAKAFEAENPNIKVEYTGGGSTYIESLKAAIATGDPPELFGVQHTYFKEMARDGVLVVMDDLYKKNGWEKKLIPMTIGWNKVDGKLYGVSATDVFVHEWYYNKELFQKAGVKPTSSVDELSILVKKLKNSGVQFPVVQNFKDGWSNVSFYGMITAQTAGIKPIDVATESKNWEQPGFLKAAQIENRLVTEGVFERNLTGIGHTDAVALFGSGKAAIYPTLTAAHSMIISAFKEGVGLDKLDIFDNVVNFVDNPVNRYSAGGGMIWAIPKSNKHKEETIAFLEYFMSTKTQTIITSQGAGTSPVIKANEAITDPVLLKSIDDLAKTSPDSLMFLDLIPGKAAGAFGSALQDMINGQKTPVEVLKEVNKAVR